MTWTNYHQHAHYCDGKGTTEEHVIAAIQLGMKSLGMTSHCPVPFPNPWSMDINQVEQYVQEILTLKEKYQDAIELYLGLEVDYIPGMISTNHSNISSLNLDFTVGSIHFVGPDWKGMPWEIDGPSTIFERGLKEVYKNDVQKVIRDYFSLTAKMLAESPPTILGHLDKIKMQNKSKTFFDETEKWYQKELMDLLEVVKSSGVIVEVNTRGIYKKLTDEPYPGIGALKAIKSMNIPICLNSDAHHPREIILEFEQTADLLASLGFRELMVLKNGNWQPRPFRTKGIKWD